MHSKGVCHRDIKPENILLNSDFIIKIADFGFATKLEGPNGDGFLKDKLGTSGYMSPEIYTLKYRGDQSDIFAAGVVLFIMLSAHPPFQTATIMDPFFRNMRDKKQTMFWNLHNRRKPPNFYSPNFRSII
jgi:serine/threonine-protein kinase Chk1